MKKTIAIALALVMMLGLLAGCGAAETPATDAPTSAPAPTTPATEAPTSAPETEAPTETEAPAEKDYSTMTIDEIKAELTTINGGKLTVATSPDFAPYEFYAIGEDGTPTLAGFDVALSAYIADFLGLELEIIPMDFDGILLELAAKKIDLGMAGYSPDPEREDSMAFSIIYYQGGQSFVTTQDKAAQFTSMADTNNSAYQIGAQVGSIQVGLAQENSPEADLVQMGKVTDIIADLLAGNLDGAYIETAVAQSYAKNYPDLAVVLDVPYELEGSVAGVVKDNPALLAGVNLAIQAALDSGAMDQFVAEANELASGETYEGLLEDME